MQMDVSVHSVCILSGPIISYIPFLRWNSGVCSLSMVIGWTYPMGDEGADGLTK